MLSTEQRLFIFAIDLSDYGHESREYLIYAIHVIREFVKSTSLNHLPLKVMLVGFDSGVIRYVVNSEDQLEKIVTNGSEEEDEEYFPDN